MVANGLFALNSSWVTRGYSPPREPSYAACVTISSRPDIMGGQPYIAGTSISVTMILRRLADGKTPEQIVDELPSLTRANVYEAEVYAEMTQAHPEGAKIWGQDQ